MSTKKQLNKKSKFENTACECSSGLWGTYWRIIKKFPVYFVVMFFVVVVKYLLDTVAFPWTSKWAIEIYESVVAGGFSTKIWWIVMVYAGLFFVGSVGQYLSQKVWPQISRFTDYLFFSRAYKNDVDFFISRPSGQITKQLSTMAGNFKALTLDFWTGLISRVLGMLLMSVGIFLLDWRLVLLIALGVVLRTGWRFVWQRKINKKIEKLQKVSADINGVRTDSLGNAVTVKFFSAVDQENQFIWDKQEEQVSLEQSIGSLRRVQDRPTMLLWYLINLSLIFVSCYLLRQGKITVADAVFVFSAGRLLLTQFDGLVKLLVDFSEKKAAAKYAFADVVIKPAVQDKPNAKKMKKVSGKIDFNNVSFAYGAKQVLKDFSLNIKACEKIGVVGLSGAGKSTLVSLLLRAYDVDSGALYLDGTDVRDVTQDSLRQQIALVPQETDLFNRTLFDNILYANPKATRKQVIAAAKKANIHDFIMGLPNGYDTIVGNRGVKLSGGQRQRIAIARAILKNSPILVLDEATSALDSENELQIQSALQNVMTGKTTVAIAHRLSTLRNMDRIIVLEKGKIVESGTHKDLLKSDGVYRKLWDMQTDGFISE